MNDNSLVDFCEILNPHLSELSGRMSGPGRTMVLCIVSSPGVNTTNTAWTSCTLPLVKVNHLLSRSLSFCHLLYPTEHEEHLDLLATVRWAQICLSKKRRLMFVSDHLKVYFWEGEGGEREREREESKVGTHKERLSERGKIEEGERTACTPKSH